MCEEEIAANMVLKPEHDDSSQCAAAVKREDREEIIATLHAMSLYADFPDFMSQLRHKLKDVPPASGIIAQRHEVEVLAPTATQLRIR